MILVINWWEKRSSTQKILIFLLFYFLLRVGNLSRELAYEEGTYLSPGRFLLMGKGFLFDYGLTEVAGGSPFHKPPLAMLIPGILSFLTQDFVVGARLFPFFVGLVVCLLPYLLTGFWLPSWVALLSPFLFSASAHIQTDPTVGLLGASFLVGAVHFYFDEKRSKKFSLLLTLGGVVLWCGKLELALIQLFIFSCGGIFISDLRKKEFWLPLVRTQVIGVLSFVLLTWLLGIINGVGFSGSVGAVIRTMTGITSGVVSAQVDLAQNVLNRGRSEIWAALRHQKIHVLMALLWVPGILLGGFKKSLSYFMFLALMCFAPGVIYFWGTYIGDGYPRYYLSMVPPALVAFGMFLKAYKKNTLKRIVLLVGVLAVVLMLPETLKRYHSPLGLTGRPAFNGYREAAFVAQALTSPGDLILLPEASLPYIKDRQFIVDESVYFTAKENILPYGNQIKAAILGPGSGHALIQELIAPLKKQGVSSTQVGSFEVLFLKRNKYE